MIQQLLRRKFPYGFLIIICAVMIFLWVMLVWVVCVEWDVWHAGTIPWLILYHVILLLLIWSMISAITHDPGRVPAQWGFQMDNRRKIYCLICHVFKPERTHHCSTCNRCVLNMDHHWYENADYCSPWINTCIGFYNRKPFILMLFYTTLITFFNLLNLLMTIAYVSEKSGEELEERVVGLVMVVVAELMNLVIFVAILNFLRFHLALIFDNLTTLEMLELKRQGKGEEQAVSKYDIGAYYNWAQVFGTNWLSWPIPIFLDDEGPSGDAIIWPKADQANEQL